MLEEKFFLKKNFYLSGEWMYYGLGVLFFTKKRNAIYFSLALINKNPRVFIRW